MEIPKRIHWISVILFYLLACAISWPFFWWRDMLPESFASVPLPMPLKVMCIMWGPGLAAIICFFVFRRTHHRTITLSGSSSLRSVLFYVVPILGLAAVGLEMPDGSLQHLLPLLIAVVGFVNVLGEELGWRGYLQDALRPMPFVARCALIGVMWELWHFTNRTRGESLEEVARTLALFYPLTILVSIVIGWAAERTRSVAVAVTLHAWLNLAMEFPGTRTWLVAALSVPFWILLLATWPASPPVEAPVQPATGDELLEARG